MTPGTFAWYELKTTDVPGAGTFYEAVVGWTPKQSETVDMDYILFHAGQVPVAGLMELPEPMRAGGAPPHWSGYVAVADVDAATEKAKTLGGTVHKAGTDIPGVGRFSVIADPHGAVINLFRGAGTPPPATPAGTPGHFSWHELVAGDLESAFAFYAAMFGWTKSTAIDMGGMGVYQLFAHDGTDIGGMMTKPAEMPGRPRWSYYAQVPGIRDAAARITEAGGKITREPHPVPGGSWIVHGIDPQGCHVCLVSGTE